MPPIYYPPPGGGDKPPDTSGGTPGHPINLPPATQPPAGYEWKFVYIPGIGWFWGLAPSKGAESETEPTGEAK